MMAALVLQLFATAAAAAGVWSLAAAAGPVVLTPLVTAVTLLKTHSTSLKSDDLQSAASPPDITGTVQLLADPSLVARSRDAAVVFGPVSKAKENPLFAEDQPWEGANRNTYPTAAYDPADRKYKLWYNSNTKCALPRSAGNCPHLGYPAKWLPAVMGEVRTATLYAESEDGLTFNKPNLGIVSWNGSTANNIVLDAGANDYNRGVFLDLHDTNVSRRFKLFGGIDLPPDTPTGSPPTTLRTAVSKDGKVWMDHTSAASMDVAGDTANNALWDPQLKKYLAFSRRHCMSDACHINTEGQRRETRSTGTEFLGGWSNATECAHGEGSKIWYEMYSLTPFRSPEWAAGLYFAVGSFYADGTPEGRVYCELMTSADFGASWTRLAPHKEFIKHSVDGVYPAGWDSHTCFSANGVVNSEETRLYYAGGNGEWRPPVPQLR
jgi:hypothetical protein